MAMKTRQTARLVVTYSRYSSCSQNMYDVLLVMSIEYTLWITAATGLSRRSVAFRHLHWSTVHC